MKFYPFLFAGEKVLDNIEQTVRDIQEGKPLLNKYILTLAKNDSDLLDIYPSYILLQKYFRKSDLIIVGIAEGRKEAMSVMEEIIMTCYRKTGGFKLKEYILSGFEEK